MLPLLSLNCNNTSLLCHQKKEEKKIHKYSMQCFQTLHIQSKTLKLLQIKWKTNPSEGVQQKKYPLCSDSVQHKVNFSTILCLGHKRACPPCLRYFLEAKFKDNCLINNSQSWQRPWTSIWMSFNGAGAETRPPRVYFRLISRTTLSVFPDVGIFAVPWEASQK